MTLGGMMIEGGTPEFEGREPAGHLAAIVASSEDAILSKDRKAVITSWNPAAERLYGYTPEEAVGQPIAILVPRERANEEKRILARIVAGERVDHYETERVRKDGQRIFVSLTVSPIHGSEGEIVGASVIARDITERRRAEERADRLTRVTMQLAREIDPERTTEVLLEEVLPALGAQAGAVGLVTDDGEHVELVGSVGYPSEIERWQRLPLSADLPLSDVVRTGEPLWLGSLEDLYERYPTLVDTRPRYAALALIPLSVGGRTSGGVVMSFNGPREFPATERAFILAAVQQAAHALDRAKLYEAERRGRERLAFVARASETLSRSLDLDETLDSLARLAVPQVADWCAIDLAEDDGRIRNVAVAHVDPQRVELAREFQSRFPPDPDAPTGVPKVIRTGRPELVSEITEEVLESAVDDLELRRILRELGLTSSIVVPLQARDRTLGAMTLISAESGHRYGEDDLTLAQELAEHAALAVDNATLYRREHNAAIALQEALLPRRLPELPGARFAARYFPGESGLTVGGDWYDLIELEDGAISLVVGDVAGRGVGAAAVMGRLQMALRAFILAGSDPASAVTRLNELMRGLDELTMATLVHAQIDAQRRRLEYVRAGHPPPLLRHPDGSVVELNGGSTPLGVYDSLDVRSSAVDVEPSSLLLLYTDGLMERRGEDFQTGLERLKGVLAAAPQEPEECVSWVTDRLGAARRDDDVAVLAMSVE